MNTILAFIILIGLIVSIHEFGHFLTAKLFGVYVHEFSIGMGQQLFSKQGKETKYSLRLLPIGGYVSMAGENVNTEVEADKTITEDRKFYNQKYWKKIIILLAGVTMNFMLSWLIFSCIVLNLGGYVSPINTTLSGVMENSPAERAGFKVGDKITAIIVDEHRINVDNFTDIHIATYDTDGKELTWVIDRNGEVLELNAASEYNADEDRYMVGIQASADKIYEVKWYNAPYYGFRYMIDQGVGLIRSLRLLFLPGGMKQISGPIGIADVAGQAANSGILSYINLIALISLNVGIMNLLPLPVLDGGQIVIETFEKIFKRKMSEKFKFALMATCWILLLGLMFIATYNDIVRIFRV